ncbi:MAG: arylesterase [Daejeonella sp.]
MIKIPALILSITILLFAGCANNSKNEKSSTDTASILNDTSQASHVKTILFFGNSLTAGYGVEPENAFPALIGDKIDSLNLPYKIINAGLSGETTSGGKNRIQWVLKTPCDVFVLELGANDGLRGIEVKETSANLQSIIDQVKARNPDVKLVLTGMEVPPNMGRSYAADFHSIFPELAKKNNMLFVPFLLEGVAGNPELNQGDGIHPTEKGHKILAENVWSVLKPALTE